MYSLGFHQYAWNQSRYYLPQALYQGGHQASKVEAKENEQGMKSAISDEVDSLLQADFIRETLYPDWLSNSVLVKKNGKWRVFIDFTNLNEACPEDSFFLLGINQLVEAMTGYELLSFMDAYSGYNQIKMHPSDEDNTAFTTSREIYCCKVMPFVLKNVGATFQHMVDKFFKDLIGSIMKVYIDDMLVKSVLHADHLQHLGEAFDLLRKYKVKLNPENEHLGSLLVIF